LTKKNTPSIDGFSQLSLSETARKGLAKAGYDHPTPVQAGVIPPALRGENVIGQAQTGTGKTAAYLIPMLERLEEDSENAPQALVLVPTRELASQVEAEFERLAAFSQLRAVVLVGGKPMRGQLQALRSRPAIVIGTPGRILDHLGRRSLDLRHVRLVVLDEADRMLDIGFRPDIERILRVCPARRQTLLLSATVPDEVRELANKYMDNPVSLDFSPKHISVETVEQRYFTVVEEDKLKLLVALLNRDQPSQAIIFCRTKRRADRIYRRLSEIFHRVGCMHGDLPQAERTRVLQRLRNGQLRMLVATDVVGRGIDISGISHIINLDVPFASDDYVHRVGRTGRMGREGIAYTFATIEEGGQLTEIEKRINRLLQRDEIPEVQSTSAVQEKEETPRKGAEGLLGRTRKRRYRRAP
jgi:ATP-dependent RNA helicase DeaD